MTAAQLSPQHLLLLDTIDGWPILFYVEIVDIVPKLVPGYNGRLLKVLEISDNPTKSVITLDFREVDTVRMYQLLVLFLSLVEMVDNGFLFDLISPVGVQLLIDFPDELGEILGENALGPVLAIPGV